MQSVKIFRGPDPGSVEKEINDYLLEQHGSQIVQVAQTESSGSESEQSQLTITVIIQEPY